MRKFIIRTNIKKGTVEVDVSKKSKKFLKKTLKKMKKYGFAENAANVAMAIDVSVLLIARGYEGVSEKKGKLIVNVYEISKKDLKEVLKDVASFYSEMSKVVLAVDEGYGSVKVEEYTLSEEEAEALVEELFDENEEDFLEEELEEETAKEIFEQDEESLEEALTQIEEEVPELSKIEDDENPFDAPKEENQPKKKKKKKKNRHK